MGSIVLRELITIVITHILFIVRAEVCTLCKICKFEDKAGSNEAFAYSYYVKKSESRCLFRFSFLLVVLDSQVLWIRKLESRKTKYEARIRKYVHYGK